jgi:toxin ParE1/3/4
MGETKISPEALQDMRDICNYIALDNPVAADRVLYAFETNVALLASQPQLGQLKPRLRHLRLWVISEFPNYLIFYREKDERVEIVRIIHCARDWDSIFRS